MFDESYAVGLAEPPTPFVTEEHVPAGPVEPLAEWLGEESIAGSEGYAPWQAEAEGPAWESEARTSHPILTLYPLSAAVLDALGRGLWSAAINLARAAGYRDVTQLTNIVFYFRHPEVTGRKIRPDERELAAEWISIRDRIVKPALRPAPPTPTPTPTTMPAGGPVTGGPPIPATRLRWQDATDEQLAFMRAVYEQHFENSKQSRRPFVRDLPDSELDTIYGRHRARRDAAAAARDLLAAANAALAADGLAGRYQIGIVSAYRPAQHQFEIWEGFGRRGGFPAYYRRAVNEGILRPGDYGADAVQKMAPYIGQYIASPGFSNHQDGLAIDFGTGRAGSRDLSVIGTDAWFHHWLVANAARFHFEPYVKEAWHWVYRKPSQGEVWSEEATTPGVRAGRVEVPHVPMLARHRGKPPDLVLRWNDMPAAPAEIDVVVHLHGYSRTGMTLPRDIERWSGLDLAPVDGAAGQGRRRPTLTVLPRGHDTNQATSGGLYRYTFPALVGTDDLPRLVQVALDRFAAEIGAAAPRVARLILTAHSGGGSPLLRILQHHDPHEVHVFDGLYQDAGQLASWAEKRIRADRAALDAAPAGSARDYLDTKGGALRVFFRGPTAGFSRQVLRAIAPGLRPDLADRYRVEPSTLGHWQIPRQYGWRILADAAADVPNARKEVHASHEWGEEAPQLEEIADFEDPAEAEHLEPEAFEDAPYAGAEAAPFEETNGRPFEAEEQGEVGFVAEADVATLQETEDWFDRATDAIRAAVDLLKTRARISSGMRDETKLTNLVFFDRHPTRGGRDLSPSEPDFAALRDEWRELRARIVRPALTAAKAAAAATTAAAKPSYDRAGAIAYARKFWLQPCDDGFIALGASAGKDFVKVPAGTTFVHTSNPDEPEHALLPDGTTISWRDLDDCTHFISCCIGTRPGQPGGGLDITLRQLGSPPTAPFGIVRVSSMVDFLIRNRLAEFAAEKSEDETMIDKLQPGDLVAYFNKARKVYSHLTLLLPGNKIACHTYCRSDQPECTWDNDWPLGRGTSLVPATHSWSFLHIVA
ncbi:MAG: hypothetical protein E6G22_09660 [Actinobacteria bacterium]|nr:MAG: hypothetical protein E6G22_09660 [Actinomycetota bacterium]